MHVSNFVVSLSSTDRIVVLCGLWILPEIGSWVNPYTICCVLLLLHILPILRLLRPGFDPGEAAARSFTCCFRVHRRLLDWRKLHYTLSVVPGTLTYLTHTEQNPLPCLSRKILIYKTLAHTRWCKITQKVPLLQFTQLCSFSLNTLEFSHQKF